jgi:transcriptional regulator with XRE-family HTH domain
MTTRGRLLPPRGDCSAGDAEVRDGVHGAMGSKKPDLIDVEVGQRIRIQRLAAGISQSELAERIGVTFQQVQKYEKGMNRVGAGRLTKIARVLNVSVGSFFDGRDTIEQVELQGMDAPLAAMAQPYAYRLLRAYASISDPDLRETIVEFVERTANQAFVGGSGSERTPSGRH